MPKLNLINLCLLYQDVKARKQCAEPVQVRPLDESLPVWLFDPRSLELQRVRIASMLSQLPKKSLQSVTGGLGMPWCSAVKGRDNCQWGFLDDADKLLAIGRAAGMVRIHTPVPDCDIPYVIVLDEDIRRRERMRPKSSRNRSMLYWKFNFKNE